LDGAVTRFIRFMISRWLVALVAFGLASAPLHAAARTTSSHVVHDVTTVEGRHGTAGHEHDAQARGLSSGQPCCHSACTLALIPFPSSGAEPAALSGTLPILPDVMPPRASPLGIDRPPKRA
jgi:hypothetical protein